MKRLVLLAAALVQAVALLAQNRAVITGVIQDSSGAVLPGAVVTVMNQRTGVRRVAESDHRGMYFVSTLPAGAYKITVRRPGFRTAAKLGVEVGAVQNVRVDFMLELGSVQEVINVEGGFEQINTEDGSTAVTFRREPFDALPLRTKGLHGMLEFAPGVLTTPAASGEAGQFSSAGQRPNTNYFLVDGLSANNAVTGSGLMGEFPGGALPAMTSIGSLHTLAAMPEVLEVRVQTSTFAPEFGKMPGAQVAIITRSGSNEFHGEAFYSGSHEALGANNWLANRSGLPRAAARLHDFGGSFGGPLRRDQTFFFASGESIRLIQPFTFRHVVPSLEVRQNAPQHVRGVLDAYPLPAASSGGKVSERTAQVSWPSSVHTGSLRIDQAIGARGLAFVRYKETPSSSRSGYLQVNDADFRTRSFTLGVVSALTPSVTNDTRLNISRAAVDTQWAPIALDGAKTPDLTPVLPPVPGPRSGVQAVWIDGLGQILVGQGDRSRQGQWNMASTFALTSGRHQIRFGVDYQRLTPTRDRGFTAMTATYPSLDDLLNGVTPSYTTFEAGAGSSVIEVFSSFAQDTWALTPRLNVTWGMRWEFTPAPSFRAPGLSAGSGSFRSRFPSEPIALANGELLMAYEQTPIWRASYTQFAPRVGIAWRVNEASTTVLRGGFGIFYDTGFVSATELLNGAPFNRWYTALAAAGQPSITNSIDYGYAPGLRLPYTMQWNLSVERALDERSVLSVGYVGSSGRRLLRRESYVVAGTDQPRVVLATNEGVSDYHSLQVQYRRQMSRGFGGLISYTWGHSIDNGSWDSALFLVDPAHGFSRDRGPSNFDARHSLQGAFTWELPAPMGKSVATRLLRNWTLSGIGRVRTAFPIDLVSRENAFGLGFDNAARPDVIGGQSVWLLDPSAPNGRRLNPDAFRLPTDGTQGSLGRNAIRGFGLVQVDAAIERQFQMARATLGVRLEVHNVANRPSFGDPVRFLSHPLFGESTSLLSMMLGRGRPNTGLTPALQSGGPRMAQIGLHFRF